MARGLSWGPPQKCPKVASLLYGKLEFVDLKNLEEPPQCDFELRNPSLGNFQSYNFAPARPQVWSKLVDLKNFEKFGVSLWISKTSRNLKSAPQKLDFKVPKPRV